ncbi:MAG: hypothetical protein ACXWC9_03805 [Pseudobdellovibrionaceae bacterium]
MRKKQTLLTLAYLLCFLAVAPSWGQAPAQDPLLGTWKYKATFCANADEKKATQTNIFPVDWFDFEPQITLQIFNQGQQKFLRKVVDRSSCRANDVKESYFLDSIHAVKTSSTVVRGQTIYTLNSYEVIDPKVNEEAFKKCGNPLMGHILNWLAGTKYPEYFYQEMTRTYNLAIMNEKLYLRFREPEICNDSKGAHTVMIFEKRK